MRAVALTVRDEAAEDVTFLRRLYISMRWDELAPLMDWTESGKIAFLEQQFGAQRAHYANAYADAEFLIIQLENQPVGRVAIFRGNSQDIRVVDIGLLPEVRNCGFGTMILRAFFAEAALSSRSVSVHVETFNPARRLYLRLGFRDIAENGPYHLMAWRPPAP